MVKTGIAGCIGVLVGAAIVSVATGQPPTPKVLRAERFELVDARGKERAALALHRDGGLRLGIRDSDGRSRIMLGVSRQGTPFLTLCGADMAARASLHLVEHDSPELALNDKDGEERILVLLHPDGTPVLGAFGEDGTALWEAPQR